MNMTEQQINSSADISLAQAADIKRVFAKQKSHALTLRNSTADNRIAKIKKLRDAVLERRESIYRACYDDFRKPETEVDLTEIFPVKLEANHAIKQLKKWMKPVHVMPTRVTFGTRSYIRHEPMGVNLIISPWNYPVNLTLCPLVSALAAGNTAILKPSEMTPHTSAFLRELIDDLFDENEVALFEGDAEVSQQLLDLPFNHIFFTGSPAVGKIVMAAAAKHLSKVTLELGGKSPVIIDQSADIKQAAKTVVFTKYTNNGQTCIAPDYVYVHQAVQHEFVAEIKQAINRAYGQTPDIQLTNQDYARIINNHHHQRIKGLIDDAIEHGAQLDAGGITGNDGENYIPPTVLSNIDKTSKIMKEEIFGPLLPILVFGDINEVIDHINSNEKPLALYIFTKDQELARKILNGTSSGDACINTGLIHYLHANLPFGGVNHSGIGKSHGIYGFRAFSHERSVVRNLFAPTLLLAPPYNRFVKWLAKSVVKYMS
ncbi:MAG: aldehyde dehydrogenase [Nitrosomonas sp.]|nr:MAG: aldehyde dehydrogenase [Nitrosomonas sp.]